MDTDTTTNRPKNGYFALVGAYTRQCDQGIYCYDLDCESGSLTLLGALEDVVNSTFLAVNKAGTHVYSVHEGNESGEKCGFVRAYAFNRATGELTFVNEAKTSGGPLCHIALDHSESLVMVVSYHGGSVASVAVNPDGSLGGETQFIVHEGSSIHERQEQAHAHSAFITPDNRFALVCDLGTDEVYSYAIDEASQALEEESAQILVMVPGSGPRHMAFHPNGQFAYILNELSSTVCVCDFDAEKGQLSISQTITTLPDGVDCRNITAEILVSADGRFVYASNRGHNSIVQYSVNADSGALTIVGHVSSGGDHPRNFNIDPTGKLLFVANQNANNIVAYSIEEESGTLSPTGAETKVSMPVCVKFVSRSV